MGEDESGTKKMGGNYNKTQQIVKKEINPFSKIKQKITTVEYFKLTFV